jgi:hypothetical protein
MACGERLAVDSPWPCYDPAKTRRTTMRLTCLAAALALLSGGATATAESIEVTPAIPGGIAVRVWMPRFPDRDSRRQADHAARARCQIEGGRARFVRSALMQRTERHGQQGVYLYDCLR